MISREELAKIAGNTGLHLYQQEKDYLLKLFLFYYYKRFENAVFKGGTCARYLYGIDRFSEDLDFTLLHTPKRFESEVKAVLKEIRFSGIESGFRKIERFKDAFTCEIGFEGPLFTGNRQSLNKFRIDAGKRTGVLMKPLWTLIKSEYPETPEHFLVKVLDECEFLAEKLHALCNRKKGRDLYDAWFLIKRGTKANKSIIEKKLGQAGLKIGISKEEYERDMKNLAKRYPSHEQAMKEVKTFLEKAGE